MAKSEFEQKLKEMLDTYTEAAPDVWEGIAAGLAARRRRVVFRRVSFAVAAAAACLIAGILIFRDPVSAPKASAPEQTAQAQPAPAAEQTMPVIEKQERPPEQQQINDFDFNDPVHLMKIEFDSAQEDQYDILFAFTSTPASQFEEGLSDVAYTYEVNGKTVVVIPFLSEDEALSELGREDVGIDETVFVAAGEKADFDKLIAPKLV